MHAHKPKIHKKGMTSGSDALPPPFPVLVVHGTRLSRSVEKRFHSRLPLLSRLRRKKGQLLFILDDVLATARTPVPARGDGKKGEVGGRPKFRAAAPRGAWCMHKNQRSTERHDVSAADFLPPIPRVLMR